MKQLTQKKISRILLIVLSVSLISPSFLLTASEAAMPPSGTLNLQGGYSDLQMQTYTGVFNVTTIVGPDNAWAALQPLLRSVEHTIYVEIFGVNDLDILDELWDIKARNSTVDMKILIGLNSLGYPTPNKYVAYNLSQDLGVPVKWTSDQWTYTHAKFIMIDNETVIVQSGNWAKTSFPNRTLNEIGNREWSVAIHNPTVTQYYLDVFTLDWDHGSFYDIANGTGSPIIGTTTTSGAAIHPFTTIGHYNEYMEITPIFSNDTSLQGIIDLMDSANETLEIQIPYYTNVGDAGAIDEIINATIRAAQRGVAVRVISEETGADNDIVAATFAEYGIPVVWFKETWFAAMHNKGIIVDGKIVYISSINFSDTSVEDNREAGVIIENENVTLYYLEVFNYDWDRGEPGNQFIDLDYLPQPVPPNIPVQVNATFYAFEEVAQATLSYRINSGLWTNITMSNITGTTYLTWTGTIPGQVEGTFVEFKVYAQDGLSVWHTSSTKSYTVGTATTTEPPPFDLLLLLLIVGGGGGVGAVIIFVLYRMGVIGGESKTSKSTKRRKSKK